MNTTTIHRMIRVFTGYGKPDIKDDVGPNKADWPFFHRVASQDDMQDHQLLEAAERFHKYRNTQLPSIMRDAGLISKANQVESYLDKMKVRGTKAKREYEAQQAIIRKRDKLRSDARLFVRSRLNKQLPFRERQVEIALNNFMEAYECERDEAMSLFEQTKAEWKPPASKVVSFSNVDDTWTNRWGKQFTSKRIALDYTYNPDLNNALKDALGFPAVKWDGVKKKWTLQDDADVLARAKDIMTTQGMFFNELSLEQLEVSAPKEKSIERKTTEVSARIIGNSSIEMEWPFISDAFTRGQLLNEVKATQGRKFNPNNKTWTVGIGEAAPLIDRLRKYDDNEWCLRLADAIQVIPDIESFMEERAMRIAISGAASLDDKMIVAEMQENLMEHFPTGRALYPFQYVGVQFAQLAGGRCLIGDDMGIGKTIQAIAHIALNQEQLPALVVCPASVKYNWVKECRGWLPNLTVEALEGRKGVMPNADIIICNYDLISGRKDSLLDYGFNIVVCDESHYLKNIKAKRTEATLEVAKQSDSVLCLSGTAVTNRPSEFFTTLNLLRPNEFPAFFPYGQRYCDGFNNGWGWDFTGASNTDELHNRTRDFCIRRLKQEVLTELPDKVRTIMDIQPSRKELKQYSDLHRAWMDEYESHQGTGNLPAGFVLNMLTALRHECGLIKVPSTIAYIKEYREITGKPLVVFAHHTDVLRECVALLRADKDHQWRIAGITGDMPASKRQDNVEAFQAGNLDVLFCSTTAAKEGITLTAANTVVFVEREWSPAWEEQAEDRVYRIGQESDSVHAVYLSVAKTIDEKFNAVVEAKREVVKAVLDGGDMEEREGIANALIQSMIDSGDLPANFGKINKKVKA
jgi:SWI/SNF-related matrix-associated actin-dependent regulator 1 of chromatin subfamily A